VTDLSGTGRESTIIAFELIGHFSDARKHRSLIRSIQSLLRPGLIHSRHAFGFIAGAKYARHRAGLVRRI